MLHALSPSLRLAVVVLLPAATLPLHAEDEPQGYWATTKQVHVRCPQGQSAGIIDPNTGVWVVGVGNEGWLKVEGLSLTNDPCERHYIEAKDLRPVQLAFWRLDERWSHGIDVEGTHYPQGSVFETLTKNPTEKSLTIIGPSGTPTRLSLSLGLADERFFTLPWDAGGNAPYCLTQEFAEPLVTFFLRFFSYVTTPLGAILLSILILVIHIANGFSRSGSYNWSWALSILPGILVFIPLVWTFVRYEKQLERCAASRTLLAKQVDSNGFVLPVRDGDQIEPEPVIRLDGKVTSLSEEDFLLSNAYALVAVLATYLMLLIRGATMGYLSANADSAGVGSEEIPASEQGGRSMDKDIRTNALTVMPQESRGSTRHPHPRKRQTPEIEIPTHAFAFTRERTIRQTRQKTELAQAMKEEVEAETDLMRAKDNQDNLPIVFATDELEERIKLLDAERRRLEAQLAILRLEATGKLELKSLELQLADFEAKLDQLSNPPQPEDEATRYRREAEQKFNERFGRSAAVRAVAQERVDEIRKRAGGKMTRETKRQIMNIEDYAEHVIGDPSHA